MWSTLHKCRFLGEVDAVSKTVNGLQMHTQGRNLHMLSCLGEIAKAISSFLEVLQFHLSERIVCTRTSTLRAASLVSFLCALICHSCHDLCLSYLAFLFCIVIHGTSNPDRLWSSNARLRETPHGPQAHKFCAACLSIAFVRR